MNGKMLAEIADKMLTVSQMWWFGVFLSVPFLVVAFRVRNKAGGLLSVCLAGGLSGFLGYARVDEAFHEGSFSRAIMEELGSGWVAHSVAASFVPLILTTIVVVLRRPWK